MYEALICKLSQVAKHPNADALQVAKVSGYQVIVGLDNKEGDLGVFFASDGKLSEKMLFENNLYSSSERNKDPKAKPGFFGHNGRIRAIKLRQAESEGFWAPLSILEWTGVDTSDLKDGDRFSELNGELICEKYYTKATRNAQKNQSKDKKQKTIKFPNFKEHYDTGQLRHNISTIPIGAVLIISEKCHGTSGRTGKLSFTKKLNWFQKLSNKLFNCKFEQTAFDYVSGTRRTVLNTNKFDGFYANTNFREEIHQKFIEAGLHEGETFYYEIVGYTDIGNPIMGNHGIADKKLKKLYGGNMVYSYGCDPEKNKYKVLIYRLTVTLIDGKVFEVPYHQLVKRCEELQMEMVPVLVGPMIYDGDSEALMRRCELLSQGSSTLDQRHIKEGVVVRVETPGIDKAYKYKSFHFCELEGIMKNSDEYVDPEEVF